MSSRPSWIGKSIGGRYRIDELLGQGGMSAVYKALDPNLKRIVAVKLIHSHLADDPKFILRFEEEAKAVAQLRHPHIVQIFDYNHDGDTYFMVQEFIAGETLQARLRRLSKDGRLMAQSDAIRYIIQICDAAGYAHQRGMIHRDIKPANIMLDTQDQAILMDFGIVKIAGGEQHTATGAVVGTAMYLSPEMIRGETPDARSDIYSLGVTLFEMVSGKPPFQADSAMTLMMMHLNDPIPDLRTLRPEVSPDLVKVIERALAKTSQTRFASMAEMAQALTRLQSSLQQPLPPEVTLVGTGQTLADSQPVPNSDFPPPLTPPLAVAEATIPESPGLPIKKNPPQPPAESNIEKTITEGTPPPIRQNPQTLSTSQVPGVKPAPPLPEVVEKPRKGNKILLWIAVGLPILVLVVLGIYLVSKGGFPSSQAGIDLPTQTNQLSDNTPTNQAQFVGALSTETQTPTATLEPSPTFTPPPTAIPSPTPIPTPTIPVGMNYVRINAITVEDQNRYVVDYETFEYTEQLPGQHVHFFFDTVPPEQAGNPGKGPWKLYGGPRPFTGYKVTDRPENAGQLCALVANPGHSVQPDSGTCFPLPDVVTVLPGIATSCRLGPGEVFPPAADLQPLQVLLVRGLSADESWWIVANPEQLDESCWLLRSGTVLNGDISILPLIDAPPTPEGANPTVEITNITLDDQGRYVVEFLTNGYTPALPGTHIHFFFDVFLDDQLGSASSGNRLMYGGTSPFTGYTVTDRPAQALQLCALVANPNHTVIAESGNCFNLPPSP
jgi:serine/threonine protein kinase